MAAANVGRCRLGSCTRIEGIAELIEFLEARDIVGIYTNYDTKWKVSFYSGEKIIGSDFAFNNMPRYLDYDTRVREMENVPYVFPEGSKWIPMVENQLGAEGTEYDTYRAGGMVVMVPLRYSDENSGGGDAKGDPGRPGGPGGSDDAGGVNCEDGTGGDAGEGAGGAAGGGAGGDNRNDQPGVGGR